MADTQRLPEPLIDLWEWQGSAACRGMDSSMFFHPPDERNAARENRIERAKQICKRCPALLACRNHALRVREPYGIWGGLSEDDRAGLLGVRSLRYPAPTTVADGGVRPVAEKSTPVVDDQFSWYLAHILPGGKSLRPPTKRIAAGSSSPHAKVAGRMSNEGCFLA